MKLRLHECNHVCDHVSFQLNPDDDPELDYVVKNGHDFIVLDGAKVTDEECRIVSEWKNADQNQNNASTEASLIRSIQLSCLELQRQTKSSNIKMASVVQEVAQASLIKLKAST
eukprot:10321192-Karenia_brevis.AAC.1